MQQILHSLTNFFRQKFVKRASDKLAVPISWEWRFSSGEIAFTFTYSKRNNSFQNYLLVLTSINDFSIPLAFLPRQRQSWGGLSLICLENTGKINQTKIKKLFTSNWKTLKCLLTMWSYNTSDSQTFSACNTKFIIHMEL